VAKPLPIREGAKRRERSELQQVTRALRGAMGKLGKYFTLNSFPYGKKRET